MNKQEWIPCSERLPAEDENLVVVCWVAVCGFEAEYLGGDHKYFSVVRRGEFFRGRWLTPRIGDHGVHIRAWMPYYEPEAYIEPRHACKLCCGDKTLGKGKEQMACWRCGGRGDEAADGSDSVQKLPAEVKKELAKQARDLREGKLNKQKRCK